MFEFCPIGWDFHRVNLTTIIICHGESTSPIAQGILLQTAVNLIQKAKEFGGTPTVLEKFPKANIAIQVHFHLVFKNEECLYNFAKFLASRRGHY